MARRDDRIAEEIAFHIEQQTAKHIAAGMSPEDALRAARLKFGGVAQVREATRDELRGAWLRDFGRDLRIACRSLARVPSFSVTAILTIGLGIGAAAAMFTVVDGVLLRPLPYPEADRIVQLFQIGDTGQARRQRVGAQLRRLAGADARLRGDGRDRRVPADRPRRRRAAVGAGGDGLAGLLRRHGHAAGARPRVPRRRAAARRRARGAGRGPLLGALEGRSPAVRRIDRHRRRGPRRGRRDAAWLRLSPRGGDLDAARAGRRVAVAHRAQLPRRRAGPARDRHPGGLRRAEPRLARDEGPLRQRDDDGRRRRRPHPRRDDRRRPAGAAAAAGGLAAAAPRGVHQRLEPAGGACGIAAARVRRPARARGVGGADDAPVAGRDASPSPAPARWSASALRRSRCRCSPPWDRPTRRGWIRWRCAGRRWPSRPCRRPASPSSSACSRPGAPAASGSPTPCRTAPAAAPAAGGRCGPASCSSSRRWR